jgi:vacuolar-type H+-ATPase subunit I/STV1
MMIANLSSIMGAGLIACGMILVLVQYFSRPPTSNQNIYGVLVTIIIVGAFLLGVGSFVHR